MEAKALYDFSATRDDELSFKRGDILKVVNLEDKDWYEAEIGGEKGVVPSTYLQMEPNDWYKAKMSRLAAEAHLVKKDASGRFLHHDGYFLIRDSESDRNSFSLSVKHGSSPQHFKILSRPDGQYYVWPNSVFNSINKLIDHHRTVSVSRKADAAILLRDQPESSNLYKALYAFTAESPAEVAFHKGDKIQLIEKTEESWWTGKNMRTGQEGLFPVNYVEEA
ncbi:growth factor receptor-bound protein 2-like [Littorina saxatilis]|uniref:Uncharacterized protein n=1 Tax=Littorina saxatilis TaxID=31220 RepID=A0AAN9BV38_9CAEN